jgi:hypothetical protein
MHVIQAGSYVRARSPVHIRTTTMLCRCCRCSRASRSSPGAFVTQASGRCGTSSVSLASFSRPPPFPMRGLLLLDTDCGGSRVGRRSCSATCWGTFCAHIYRDMVADVLRCVWDSPLSRGVSRCRSAHPRHRYLHNSCCIRGGDFVALICRGIRTCVSDFYPHGQCAAVFRIST